MAFEETLVCDGCSRVISGGGRWHMLGELRENGGRAFVRTSRSTWREVSHHDVDTDWLASSRHLGECCAGVHVFFDGDPVPQSLGGQR